MGKSRILTSLACASGLPVFTLRAEDVISDVTGSGLRHMTALFNVVRAAAPSCVLLDDLHTLAPAEANTPSQVCVCVSAMAH